MTASEEKKALRPCLKEIRSKAFSEKKSRAVCTFCRTGGTRLEVRSFLMAKNGSIFVQFAVFGLKNHRLM